MSKWVMRLSIAAAILALLLLGAFVAAGWFISSKTDEALAAVSSRVPGLELKNRDGTSGLLSKSGRLYVAYDAKAVGQKVTFALDYKLGFGIYGARGSYILDDSYGNLGRIIEDAIGSRPSLEGTFSTSLHDLALKSEATISGIVLKPDDGRCELPPLKANVSANAMKSVEAEIAVPSIRCSGDELYSGKPSYALSAEKISVKANPKFSGHSISSLKLELAADSVDAGASTIYLIGFRNDEPVKDPTLYEQAKAQSPSLSIDLSPSGEEGFMNVGFSAGGSYLFGFPRVRDGVEVPMTEISNLKFFGDFDSVNLKKLSSGLKAASGDADAQKRAVFAALPESPEFHLDGLSFSTGKNEASVDGSASFQLDHTAMKLSEVDAGFDVAASEDLAKDLAGKDYAEELSNAVSSGMIDRSGKMLKTKLAFRGGRLTLNGRDAVSSENE
jgi:hypothetical protein